MDPIKNLNFLPLSPSRESLGDLNRITMSRGGEEDDDEEIVVVQGPPFYAREEEYEHDEFVWDLDRPHPLCIPHIVDNILSYLDLPELRYSRLVNSQYNEIAARHLGRKEVITFNKMSHLSSYLALMSTIPATINATTMTTISGEEEDEHITEMDEQLLLGEQQQQDNKSGAIKKKERKHVVPINPTTNAARILSHTNFHFNFDPDNSNLDEETGILETFFDTMGQKIVDLKYTTDLIPLNFPKRLPHLGNIWKGRVPSLETLRLEIKWGCPESLFEKDDNHNNDDDNSGVILSSVKKLELDILVTERDADRVKVFLAELLSATPNLEEISIPGSKKFFDDYINVLLGRLILSMNLPRLSTLNFCLAFNPGQMVELATKNFPLNTVILDFAEIHHFSFPNQNVILERSLEILFAQTATTLKTLHLCFPYIPEHPLHRFTFPEPMTNLKYLALGRFYGSISILNKLPKLKKLDLWSVRFHDFNHEQQKSSEMCKEIFAVPTQYLSITTVIS